MMEVMADISVVILVGDDREQGYDEIGEDEIVYIIGRGEIKIIEAFMIYSTL